MKFCGKCGAPCADYLNTCPECGNILSSSDDTNTNNNINPYNQQYNAGNSNPNGGPYQYGNPNNGQNANGNGYVQYQAPNPTGFTERSIPLAIILSIITCGIYGIYWMIVLNDDINRLSGEPNATSGGMVFLLTLITCGIYGIYWAYKMGERCDRINGVDGNSNILYLVVALLGFSIINYCLMQDTINKRVRAQQGRY